MVPARIPLSFVFCWSFYLWCSVPIDDLALCSNAEARSIGALVEHNVHCLHEDITEDRKTNTSIGLNAAEASRARLVNWGIVDV